MFLALYILNSTGVWRLACNGRQGPEWRPGGGGGHTATARLGGLPDTPGAGAVLVMVAALAPATPSPP